MNTAIYFHPEAYTTIGPSLMGRNAAGESFLRGFLAYSRNDQFWLQVQQADHANSFVSAAREAGRNQPINIVDNSCLGALSQSGMVYFPGPGIGRHSWHRSFFGHKSWSLCGVTHTTAEADTMDSIVEWLTAPVQPWDAVICTSSAVKDNVQKLLQAQAEHLEQRLGITRALLPQLPVIPLGIHTDDFRFSSSSRAAARIVIGADEMTKVVLFIGRLSFHAKAHPLAMYQALERASCGLPAGEKVLLVECGWHANEHIKNAFADAARIACPNVRVLTLDGRKPEERKIAWASGDIFCSLSDNIQETFGIVPLEAMAAGLPVVVSDWDGYKDTVRDGVDGFRIPTTMPNAGLGVDLACRYALDIDTYDMYCGHSCMLVSVDIDAAADAFKKLFASEDLRRSMGEAGRKRALEIYDWAVIMPQYEALWGELQEIRMKSEATELQRPWPARMDPFFGFSSYPTKTITTDTLFSLVDIDISAALKRVNEYRQLAMVNFADFVIPADEEIRSVVELIAGGAQPASALISDLSPDRQMVVFRALNWLLKTGIIRIASEVS